MRKRQPGYPIMLHVAGQCCLVVGGGKIATRKVTGLLAADAEVVVMSPTLTPTLASYAAERHLKVYYTHYLPGFLTVLRPLLVFAATDQPSVNQQISHEARAARILVDAVDAGGQRDFSNMAVVRHGAVTVGISTNGVSPTLAAQVRHQIEQSFAQGVAVDPVDVRDVPIFN